MTALIDGPVGSRLLRFVLPILAGNILQQLFLVLRNICVDFLIQCLIHDLIVPFCPAALRRRFQNTFLF